MRQHFASGVALALVAVLIWGALVANNLYLRHERPAKQGGSVPT